MSRNPFFFFSFACSSSVVLFFHSSLITHFRWASASMSWCWWERISFVSIPEKSRVFCCRARSEVEEKYFGWTLFVFGVSFGFDHLRFSPSNNIPIYGIVCVNMISLIYWKWLQNWAICWLSELSSFFFPLPPPKVSAYLSTWLRWISIFSDIVLIAWRRDRAGVCENGSNPNKSLLIARTLLTRHESPRGPMPCWCDVLEFEKMQKTNFCIVRRVGVARGSEINNTHSKYIGETEI